MYRDDGAEGGDGCNEDGQSCSARAESWLRILPGRGDATAQSLRGRAAPFEAPPKNILFRLWKTIENSWSAGTIFFKLADLILSTRCALLSNGNKTELKSEHLACFILKALLVS